MRLIHLLNEMTLIHLHVRWILLIELALETCRVNDEQVDAFDEILVGGYEPNSWQGENEGVRFCDPIIRR